MSALWSQAKVWLWAVLAGIAVALLAAAYAFGRRSEEAQQMRRRMRGATERAHADIEAARADDPVGELQRGGWVRDVASDRDPLGR
ncbi:hypothetical protein GXW78_26830 [Roseomonas terrae]|uniref:Uncharacterized protein n=1 Tax=Neoroseomonas terrae TaxID=424799 RepID=A0ABS5EQI3_9PROT|nr:hypothetical protein [Neoroseomonas terrae]MBR0653297.1 hypothetical protein [Neoroseomonas terrae]